MKAAITIILFLVLCPAAYAQEPATTKEKSGSVQGEATAAKGDDRLPFQREGWQFFLAPYLWIPNIHLDLRHQGRFSGSTVVDIPWYNLVPPLFSKLFGGMGHVEIWNGSWGVFSNTEFFYIGDSVSAGGVKELKLNPKGLSATIPVRLQLSGDLKVWARLIWQDVGVRYLVGTVPLNADKPLPVMTCELMGGLRYTYLNTDMSLGLNATLTGPSGQFSQGGSFFDSVHLSFAEPLVGMRIGLWFTQKLNLILKADCGGFGFVAYNNVTTVIEGFVGYKVHKNIRIYGGYSGRYLSVSGSTKDIALHGWLHGPKLGAEFSF